MATAEDITQETCLAVMVMFPRHRWDDNAFWPMVFGVAANKLADARRRAFRDQSVPAAELPENPDDSAGPDGHTQRGEHTAELAALLRVLPENQRLLLWFGLGLSAEQVAAKLGCTPGALRVRQHRALNRLRRHLAETYFVGGVKPAAMAGGAGDAAAAAILTGWGGQPQGLTTIVRDRAVHPSAVRLD